MPPQRTSAPFPSDAQLEKMGFVRCQSQPCSSFINPVDLTETNGKCQRHHWAFQPKRKEPRELSNLAELRFAPRPERRQRRRAA